MCLQCPSFQALRADELKTVNKSRIKKNINFIAKYESKTNVRMNFSFCNVMLVKRKSIDGDRMHSWCLTGCVHRSTNSTNIDAHQITQCKSQALHYFSLKLV